VRKLLKGNGSGNGKAKEKRGEIAVSVLVRLCKRIRAGVCIIQVKKAGKKIRNQKATDFYTFISQNVWQQKGKKWSRSGRSSPLII